MKNNNDIDKLFKDKLEVADCLVIPQSFLNDINSKLDNIPKPVNRVRTATKFWMLSLGIAAFGVFYILNKQNNNVSEIIVKQKTVAKTEKEIANPQKITSPVIEKTTRLKSNDVSLDNSRSKEIEVLAALNGSIKYTRYISSNTTADESSSTFQLEGKKEKITKGQIQKNMHEITLYTKAIEQNPYDEYAYCNRGVSKENLHDFKGAISDFSKAIALNSGFVGAYYNRANALIKIFDYKNAIKDFSKAIELNPNFSEAYNNRGFVKEIMRNSKGALLDYTKAISIKPDYVEAYYNRGLTNESLNDNKAAIRDYSKVIELNPAVEEAYSNKAFIENKNEDYEAALSDYTKAIELNPNNGINYNQRGQVKHLLKDDEGACIDWRRAMELGEPSTDIFTENCK